MHWPTQHIAQSLCCLALRYKAVPCPVAKHGLELQFLDFSKPVRILGSPAGAAVLPELCSHLWEMSFTAAHRHPARHLEPLLSWATTRLTRLLASNDSVGLSYPYADPGGQGHLQQPVQ